MATELGGRQLAESAFIHLRHSDPNRRGILIEDLVRHLESNGIRIKGDDPWSTLRSAMNAAHDLFVYSDATWSWIEPKLAVGTEVSGKALADLIYVHVQRRYPNERNFHYETAKEQMLKDGVGIKGPVTGRTMRSALVGAKDRFEPLGRGMWRWK